jgi:hypothetical protein
VLDFGATQVDVDKDREGDEELGDVSELSE